MPNSSPLPSPDLPPSEPLPHRGQPSPPAGDRMPPGDPMPHRGQPSPPPGEPLPHRGQPSPPPGEPLPHRGQAPPLPGEPLPRRGQPSPPPGDAMPQRLPNGDQPLRRRGQPVPGGEPLPRRGEAFAQPSGPFPGRGEPTADGSGLLPRRTTRSRRPGRHRSPHRLTVASDAPVLVIAVPGAAAADAEGIADQVAAIAGESCPGVEIRVGYLDGSVRTLAEAVDFGGARASTDQPRAVVVPLLAAPHPEIDARLAVLLRNVSDSVMLGAHLGPHPLVAEALHSRLAETGLARQSRSRGLSIAALTRGVLVLADRGDEAVEAAGVAAVLLASRVAVPTAPASLGDPAGITSAVSRLGEAGAGTPVIAPCLIGPETPGDELAAVATALDAPCAPPLGAHQAVGQLVAVRYGAALAGLSAASSTG